LGRSGLLRGKDQGQGSGAGNDIHFGLLAALEARQQMPHL
jgi:hypothetical protein